MAWPEDLTTLLKRISTPAEEVFKGLRVLGDYNKTSIGVSDAVIKAHLRDIRQHGEVFVVNGGSDTNLGTMASPLLTMKKALSLCEANRNDYILVGSNYWQPVGEDWPIVVNKHQVHIIGLSVPNLPGPAIHPVGNFAAFDLANTGQGCEIAKLTIGGGSAHGGVETGSIALGMGNQLLLRDCWFGHEWFGTPLSGFRNLGTINACGVRFERCRFFGDQAGCAGKISGDGIDNALGAGGSWDHCEIIDCIFMGVSSGIDFDTASGCMILGNKFYVVDNLQGSAISLAAACLGCLVDGNSAASKKTTGVSTNPYEDAGTNAWGANYTGGALAFPA